MNYNTARQQLIEVASLRPDDIQNFYSRYIIKIDGCFFLTNEAPEHLSVLYRGKIKKFKANEVPILLAGVRADAQHTCGFRACINPDHMRS
jgi:hypothetical protein